MSEAMQQYEAWKERGQELVARLREERRTVLDRLIQIDNALNLLGVRPGANACKKRKPSILRGPVTSAQVRVLRVIRDSVASQGFPPTVREIAKGVDCKSINNVSEHLAALERKGFLTVKHNVSRGLAITEAGMKILAAEAAESEGPALCSTCLGTGRTMSPGGSDPCPDCDGERRVASYADGQRALRHKCPAPAGNDSGKGNGQ